MTVLASIRDLTVTYRRDGSEVAALRNISLDIMAGERLAIIGESGSGKSTLALAIAGLLPASPRSKAASIGSTIVTLGAKHPLCPAGHLPRGGRLARLRFRQSRTLQKVSVGEARSPPSRGRCPAGQRGV